MCMLNGWMVGWMGSRELSASWAIYGPNGKEKESNQEFISLRN